MKLRTSTRHQIVLCKGPKRVLQWLAIRARAGSRPISVLQVVDDASNAAVYEKSAEIASNRLLCFVVWYIANGQQHKYDGTIVADPNPTPNGPKPVEYIDPTGDFSTDVLQASEKFIRCIRRANAR
jgi:hypothetical protein